MPRNLVQAAAFLFGFWFALWLSPLRVQATEDARQPTHPALEQSLLEEVNRVRSERNLIPLTRDPAIDAVARAHSADMAHRGYLAHETPEGLTPVHRLAAGEVEGFSLAAENIGSTDRANPTREIVTHWLQSPVHRQNLYAPPFNTTGIGVVRAASGAWIYTQLYLSRPVEAASN